MKTSPPLDQQPIAPAADAAPIKEADENSPATHVPLLAHQLVSSNTNGQPWQLHGNKYTHSKKLRPPPFGTRRSMGKR